MDIRLRGLALLAQCRIQEGLPLCLQLVEIDRWGADKRIEGCLKALETYGGAAKSQLPQLRQLEQQLSQPKAKCANRVGAVRHAIVAIESAQDAAPLRSLGTAKALDSGTGGHDTPRP